MTQMATDAFFVGRISPKLYVHVGDEEQLLAIPASPSV
jgi:hypothetical protein